MPDGSPPATFEALAGGLHDTAVAIRHDGSQHGIQLAVTASGCRALFGMPAAELARTVITLHEVMPPAAELCDRLRSASGWPQRFAILDAVLTRLAVAPCLEPAAALAWKWLCQSDGRLRVDELARDAGYSRRHLTARFRAEYGLAPKTAARVMRFERARALLVRPEPPSLARIAAACGYADQAHMNREWRALAGASPLGWRAAEVLPFVQDGDRAGGAVSGA